MGPDNHKGARRSPQTPHIQSTFKVRRDPALDLAELTSIHTASTTIVF